MMHVAAANDNGCSETVSDESEITPRLCAKSFSIGPIVTLEGIRRVAYRVRNFGKLPRKTRKRDKKLSVIGIEMIDV